jgi:hypothetical protein
MKKILPFTLVLTALCVVNSIASTKTENNIAIVKTANSSAGVGFILITPNTNLTSFCSGNWVKVSDNAMMANILSAISQGKQTNMITIDNAQPANTVYTPTGAITTTCRVEWVEFSFP